MAVQAKVSGKLSGLLHLGDIGLRDAKHPRKLDLVAELGDFDHRLAAEERFLFILLGLFHVDASS